MRVLVDEQVGEAERERGDRGPCSDRGRERSPAGCGPAQRRDDDRKGGEGSALLQPGRDDEEGEAGEPALREQQGCAAYEECGERRVFGDQRGGREQRREQQHSGGRCSRAALWQHAAHERVRAEEQHGALQEEQRRRAGDHAAEHAPHLGQHRRVPVGEHAGARIDELVECVGPHVAGIAEQHEQRPGSDEDAARLHRRCRLCTNNTTVPITMLVTIQCE